MKNTHVISNSYNMALSLLGTVFAVLNLIIKTLIEKEIQNKS